MRYVLNLLVVAVEAQVEGVAGVADVARVAQRQDAFRLAAVAPMGVHRRQQHCRFAWSPIGSVSHVALQAKSEIQ